ncbi:MAG: anthranilate phosphoribosyltransferase [Pseudobdellovibrionaceae bacterium]
MIKDILHHLAERGDLSAPQLHDFTCAILDGLCSPAQTGAFLMALAQRPITSDYIVAAVTAIRARAIKLTLFPEAIDCCGTGGDHSQSLNISTATGFVAAACGVKIAKHGNRAATSRSGAADVLEALGVNLDLSLFQEEQALDHIGFSFLMAPNHHPALKNLAPIRRELGFRTLFNLLGPLANPAGTQRQLIGVYDRALCDPVAQALRDLGSSAAIIVHGADGLDEISLCGETYYSMLQNGTITSGVWSPADFGLGLIAPDSITGGDASFNARALMGLLEGTPSAYSDIVLANTAATLLLAGIAPTLPEGVAMGRDALSSGKALRVFTDYRDYTTTIL